MDFNPILHQILSTRKVEDENGNTYDLHSEITKDEGDLLVSLINRFTFNNTLEIGCAFGISSLYICEALCHQRTPHHTIIDPFQKSEWHGVGLANLKKAGFNFYELLEKPSEIALPTLLADGRRFQFALIDGWHTFDHALLDFFYLNRLLEVGGVVAFDDADWMPSIKQVARYIINYPNYKLLTPASSKTTPSYLWSTKRKIVDSTIRFLAKMLPQSYVNEVFSPSWRRPDFSLDGCGSMIAFQKMGPDERNWDWYMPF